MSLQAATTTNALQAEITNLAVSVFQIIGQLKTSLATKRNDKTISQESINEVAGIISDYEAIYNVLMTVPQTEETYHQYNRQCKILRHRATTLLQVAVVAFPIMFNSKFSNAFELVSHVKRSTAIAKVVGDKIPLPQILVIGMQSSGKSSVLRRMLGLNLFRTGAGTVTRFPVEIRVKRNAAINGYRILSVHLNNLVDSKSYPVLTTESELMDNIDRMLSLLYAMLKKAQESKVNTRKTKIMKDRVVIDIETNFTTVENISCIDLPGLIKNSDAEFPDDGIVTEEIIEEYVTAFPQANIVIVVDNSERASNNVLPLLKKMNQKHSLQWEKRAIGVITKADANVGRENVRTWLENVLTPLGNGWHVLVNPSEEDDTALYECHNNSNWNFASIAEKEMSYFKNKSKLYATTIDELKSRFGIGSLQKAVAQVFHETLCSNLEKISSELNSTIAVAQQKQQKFNKFNNSVITGSELTVEVLMNFIGNFLPSCSPISIAQIENKIAKYEKGWELTSSSDFKHIHKFVRSLFDDCFCDKQILALDVDGEFRYRMAKEMNIWLRGLVYEPVWLEFEKQLEHLIAVEVQARKRNMNLSLRTKSNFQSVLCDNLLYYIDQAYERSYIAVTENKATLNMKALDIKQESAKEIAILSSALEDLTKVIEELKETKNE